MAVITATFAGADPADAARQHPLLRATAWSSAIGLVAGLVLGLVTQAQEHDRG
ncbi:MAG: hypothetical protein ACTHN8_17260 [Angustibacter sp.]